VNRTLLVVLIVVGVLLGALLLALFAVAFAGGRSDGGVAIGKGLGYVEVEGTIVESEDIVRQLKSLEANSMVKGILLRINSPGGVVAPSHDIYAEVKRISEEGTPVIASFGSLAASGGYYIAAPADLIIASPQTLTGSIGVIMEFPVVERAMDKLGLSVEVIKSREHKDVGSPFRQMTDRDRGLLQGVVADAYDQFVEVVSQGRELPRDSVMAFADGRIFTGRQALALGLVDTLGTFEESKRIAAQFCGIDGEPRLIRAPRRMNWWWRRLMESTGDALFGRLRSPRLSYTWY
jgi:protease-4